MHDESATRPGLFQPNASEVEWEEDLTLAVRDASEVFVALRSGDRRPLDRVLKMSFQGADVRIVGQYKIAPLERNIDGAVRTKGILALAVLVKGPPMKASKLNEIAERLKAFVRYLPGAPVQAGLHTVQLLTTADPGEITELETSFLLDPDAEKIRQYLYEAGRDFRVMSLSFSEFDR